MKAIYLALLIPAFAHANAAAVNKKHEFVCHTVDVIEKKAATEVRFTVSNLENGKPELEADSGSEDGPIAMEPKDSILDLNDNWEFHAGKEKLTINSDGDGCQWTTFVLYKDSDLKNGYVQVKGDKGCGMGDYYSKVTCKINEK